ncbi:hypothetical protein G7Y79_00052g087330 [Physcia stellaris]|nr:hypothetical protein G7Y79_00052g087330 [Physcia stellaris]
MPVRKEAQFQCSDVPDLRGYVVIVTGGNSGIGYETTLQLASRHARVYVAARSEARVKEAFHSMRQSDQAANYDLRFLSLDLQSFESVRTAAKAFLETESRLDLLINNAGVMAVPFALTEDGFETQWQTNHLAHHLLFTSLLPLLQTTAAAHEDKNRVRVVNVSAEAYAIGPSVLDLEDPNLESTTGTLAAWKRYGHSKLANIVHARAIHNRYRSSGISAFSLHPGIINTNLQKADPTFLGSFTRFAVRWGLIPGTMSIRDGARTTLFCATSPDATRWSGRYVLPYGKVDGKVDKWIEDAKAVQDLWEAAERMVNEKRQVKGGAAYGPQFDSPFDLSDFDLSTFRGTVNPESISKLEDGFVYLPPKKPAASSEGVDFCQLNQVFFYLLACYIP